MQPKTELRSSLEEFSEHDSSSPLAVHSMTVAYNQKPVLWDVDYDAPANGLIAIVGPNGAGKSTFIKSCLGLIPRASGVVEFWGRPFNSVRQKVGYVPQRESVDWDFPISALEVVAMGRYGKVGWCRRIGKEHWQKSRYYLEQVDLAKFADRQINQLSGGQQQRVFLARALAQEADLYFMDEPFAGVDAATANKVAETLSMLKARGATVLCVHHDLVTVPEYFDHVLLMNMRVIAFGTIKDAFTEERLKSTYGARLTLLDEVSQALAGNRRG